MVLWFFELKSNRVIAGAVLLTVLILGAYTFYPRESTEENQDLSGVVQIGVISPTDEDLPKYTYMAGLAESDLNSLCAESGQNISFIFQIFSANRMGSTALEITQSLHGAGVDLVVGGGWSSQLCVMRSYVNYNEILVISPSSTNPQEFSLQNDYIFRLCTHDFMIGEIMAEVSESLGLDSVLIIERGDAWAEGVGNWFERDYGGELVGQIRYLAETSEFDDILDEAECRLSEIDASDSSVGVFLIAFSESKELLAGLSSYPLLSNVTWLGTEPMIETLVPTGIDHVIQNIRLISPMITPVPSERVDEIALDYQAEVGDVLDFYDASIYDSCMVLGLSVIEADSTNGSVVRDVLPDVAEGYVGLTGPCGLDVNGDRRVFQMGLYELSTDPAQRWRLIGHFNSLDKTVSWIDD